MDGPGRGAMVAAAAVLIVGGAVTGSSAEEAEAPEVAGEWTQPFEEGGAGAPRCVPAENDPGFLVCKPTAQASAMLPDGRVLYWNGFDGQESAGGAGAVSLGTGAVSLGASARNSRARVLDLRSGGPEWVVPTPERGAHTNPDADPGGAGDGDMFCADVTTLADGRVLIAGGTQWHSESGVVEAEGLRSASVFDYRSDTFTPVGPMKYGRWNPGMAVQGDGSVLVAGGAASVTGRSQGGQVRRTEVFDPATDRWDEKYSTGASEASLPMQPRLFLTPSGKTLYTGVGQMAGPVGPGADEALMMFHQLWDPESETWEVAGLGPLGGRSGTQVVAELMEPPYDRLHLVTFGGTLGPPPGNGVANGFTTVTTIDTADQITHRTVGELNHARWFPSGVLLPDGKILAVGGADKDEAVHPRLGVAVKVPELYDPASGAWDEVAEHARDRTAHNSAILLPDMRVLLGGHAPMASHYGGAGAEPGGPFANNHKDPSFEVWSPPYLFRGERPRITRAPAGLAYGAAFDLGTPEAADIDSVVLLRTPSAQHVNDSDGRGLKLEFNRAGASTLLVTAPPSGTVAPPGFYYLVVNKKTLRGPVPSVARIVNLGTLDASEATQPMPSDAPAPRRGSATPIDEDGTSPAIGLSSLAVLAPRRFRR